MTDSCYICMNKVTAALTTIRGSFHAPLLPYSAPSPAKNPSTSLAPAELPEWRYMIIRGIRNWQESNSVRENQFLPVVMWLLKFRKMTPIINSKVTKISFICIGEVPSTF